MPKKLTAQDVGEAFLKVNLEERHSDAKWTDIWDRLKKHQRYAYSRMAELLNEKLDEEEGTLDANYRKAH